MTAIMTKRGNEIPCQALCSDSTPAPGALAQANNYELLQATQRIKHEENFQVIIIRL